MFLSVPRAGQMSGVMHKRSRDAHGLSAIPEPAHDSMHSAMLSAKLYCICILATVTLAVLLVLFAQCSLLALVKPGVSLRYS